MDNKKYLEVFERYVDAFPEVEMFDSRGISAEDFENLENLMVMALERGSALTEADLKYSIGQPDPVLGLMT